MQTNKVKAKKKQQPIMPASDMLDGALKWRIENEAAWEWMVSKALQRVKAGKAWSIVGLVVILRESQGVRVPNYMRAPLARLLVKENPILDVGLRVHQPSKVDRFFEKNKGVSNAKTAK